MPEFETKEEVQAERERLHKLIERLVVWENVQPDSEGDVVGEARREIARSLARDPSTGTRAAPTDPEAVLAYLREHAPPLHDPFAGGGSIPLEAQRLGLRAIASDLNPLAVLINKAMIELPPKFRDQPPVNPEADRMGMTVGKGRKTRHVAWRGAAGLADDIRYLRALDARRGVQAHWAPLPEGQAAGTGARPRSSPGCGPARFPAPTRPAGCGCR